MQFTIAQIAMCKISLLYWSMDSVVVAWRAFDLALYTPSVSRHLQLSWERKYITAQQLTNIGVILKFKQELISTNFLANSETWYKSKEKIEIMQTNGGNYSMENILCYLGWVYIVYLPKIIVDDLAFQGHGSKTPFSKKSLCFNVHGYLLS